MTDDTRGLWAKCTVCTHCWIVAHLPMELTAAAQFALAARCPHCGAGSPRVAKQSGGILLEQHHAPESASDQSSEPPTAAADSRTQADLDAISATFAVPEPQFSMIKRQGYEEGFHAGTAAAIELIEMRAGAWKRRSIGKFVLLAQGIAQLEPPVWPEGTGNPPGLAELMEGDAAGDTDRIEVLP